MFDYFDHLNISPTPSVSTSTISNTTRHSESLHSFNQRISLSEETSDQNMIKYNVVTDTVSLLPYIGIWDINDYNGLEKVVSTIVEPDGK